MQHCERMRFHSLDPGLLAERRVQVDLEREGAQVVSPRQATCTLPRVFPARQRCRVRQLFKPCLPALKDEFVPPGDQQYRSSEACGLTKPVGVSGCDLSGNRLQKLQLLVDSEGGVEGQLHDQVGAMRNAVAPADLWVETAIVGYAFQVISGYIHQVLALPRAHPGVDSIRARDFCEHENGKRMGHADRVWLPQQLVQLSGQDFELFGGRTLVAKDFRQPRVSKLVT